MSKLNKPGKGSIKKPEGLVYTRNRWRWTPSPKWRAAGYKGKNLVNEDGSLPDQFQAYRLCAEWNEQLAGAKADVAHVGEDRSIDGLVKRYRQSARFTTLIAPRTREDYDRLMDKLTSPQHFGGVALASLTRVMLEDHFVKLVAVQPTQGHHLYRMLRTLMYFAIDLEWITRNPCRSLKGVKAPAGRRNPWMAGEIIAFIKCAEFLEIPCQADAVILALTTAASVTDVLMLPRLIADPGGFFALPPRRKTGIYPFAPCTPLLIDRLRRMGQRHASMWPGQQFDRQLVYTRTGGPYEYNTFQDLNYAVRLLAAGDLEGFNSRRQARVLPAVKSLDQLPFTPAPSLGDKQFSDLRATATTRYLAAAGLEAQAVITGHALGRSEDGTRQDGAHVIDKHYFARQGSTVAASNAAVAFDDLTAELLPRPRAAG